MKKKMIFIIAAVLIIIVAVYIGINKSQDNGSTNKTNSAASASKKDNVNKNTSENNKKVAAVNKTQGKVAETQSKDVKDSALNVSVGSASSSVSGSGEIPINFENATENGINACELLIKYDAAVIKIEEINPGKIVEDPKVNFFAKNDEKTGQMKIFYMPNTKEGKDITKKGDFAKIKFQIKQGAKKGVSSIEVVQSSVFCDKALHKYKASIKNGNITVK